jgi:hypothetical protein
VSPPSAETTIRPPRPTCRAGPASRRSGRAGATTSIRIFQQLGGSFGIAIIAVVLQQQATGAATTSALASAFGHTFWWALGFTA